MLGKDGDEYSVKSEQEPCTPPPLPLEPPASSVPYPSSFIGVEPDEDREVGAPFGGELWPLSGVEQLSRPGIVGKRCKL